MCKRTIIFLATFLASLAVSAQGEARTDSVETKGIVRKTAEWYRRTFTTYDTAYVANRRLLAIYPEMIGWHETHHFKFHNSDCEIGMFAPPTFSIGAKIRYKSFSVGYSQRVDINGFSNRTKMTQLGYCNCRFSLDFSYTENDGATRITSLTTPNEKRCKLSLDYDGLSSESLVLDAAYYFNGRRYSHTASTKMYRRQIRSCGSFFVGFRFEDYRLRLDYDALPTEISPLVNANGEARLAYNSYLLTGGYGHNFVRSHGWLFNISEALSLGLLCGLLRPAPHRQSLGFSNKLRLVAAKSFGENFYLNAHCTAEFSMFDTPDFHHTHGLITFGASVGYCFDAFWK